MALSKEDMDELRRMAVNFYDDDKVRMNRIIREISLLVSENANLSAQLTQLKAERAKAAAAKK